ncbi:MAG: aminotransferase class I/II-fold pyridoxal phosphate-dependent enzyme [Chloroherpetonaceae bacterium]|nr:aminotransferase class I/II-fold pyridoxal phosphate-dependent enzyme [Chloroherpetonaceae bacterium]
MSVPYQPARRTQNYKYAIRNIVSEAKKIEAQGRRVTYLNIGDPSLYGFQPPQELIEAAIKAMRDGHNGYSPSVGILEARQAVADEAAHRGIPTSPEDVIFTYGASEAADLVFTALLEPGDEVLVPAPGYPLYTAIATKLGAVEVKYRQNAQNNWQPDADELRCKVTSRTKLLVIINPNNPTGALYSEATLRAMLQVAREHKLVVIADEVYHKLIFEGKHIPIGSLADKDLPVITMESLSKNYLAPGWRLGWMSVTNSHLIPDLMAAIRKLADARLCAPMPPQHVIKTALQLPASYLEPTLTRLRQQRDITFEALNRIPGIRCNKPEGAFYAMAQVDLQQGELGTDEEFVLGLLREKAVLFVHGSGFGTHPTEGFFRVVFLPDAETLKDVYARVADFTRVFRETRLSAVAK